jgi:hypothetical protein
MTRSDMAPRRVKLVSALLVIGVFAAGAAAGFGLGRLCCAAPPPPHQELSFRPPSLEALHLTREQEAKAREIGDRHRPEIEAIRREVAPKVHAIHRRMQEELEAFLTPEQRAQQDEAQKRMGVGPKDGPPEEMGAPPPGGPGF